MKDLMKTMYNKKIKDQFMQYCEKVFESNMCYKTMPIVLKKISKIEKQYEIDLFNAMGDTLLEMLAEICSGLKSSQTSYLSMCKRYIEWAILNGKSKVEDINLDIITTDSLPISSQYLKKHIKNYEDLCSYLEVVFHHPDDEYTDLPYYVISLLIYEGFTLNEVLNLKKDDFSDGVITYNNKTIKLHVQTISILNDFLNLIHLNCDSDYRSRKRPILESEYLINNTSKSRDFNNFKLLYSVNLNKGIEYYKKEVGIVRKITSNGIYMCGVFNIIRNKLLNGEIDDNEIEKVLNIYFPVKNKYQLNFVYQDYKIWESLLF